MKSLNFFKPSHKLVFIILLVIASISARIAEAQSTNGIWLNVKENDTETRNTSSVPIVQDTLYSDCLPPNYSKSYRLMVPRTSILILCLKVDGNVEPGIYFQGNVSFLSIVSPPFPGNIIGRLYYANADGEVTIIIVNFKIERDIIYSFFVDVTEPLQGKNSKRIPLEGGIVGFHIDLKREEEVYIKFSSYPKSNLEVRPYVLYYLFSSDYRGYLLRSFSETSINSLNFKGDLQGRYYILVKADQSIETLSLTSFLTSPPWRQGWFWPFLGLSLLAILSLFFLFVFRMRKPSEEVKYTLLASYFSLITLALFVNLIGAYDSRSPALITFLYSSILSYGMSLGVQVYASYLSRRSPFVICPHCLQRIDSRLSTFCCDRIIKRVSNNWCLAPVAFGLFAFLASSSLLFHTSYLFEVELPVLPSTTLWMGGMGCLIGGLVAWGVNRKVDRKKSWSFLILGLVLSCLFPPLASFALYLDFMGVFEPVKYVEAVYPNLVRLLVRVNTLPTVPLGSILILAIIITFLSYLLLLQVKIALIIVLNSNQGRNPDRR